MSDSISNCVHELETLRMKYGYFVWDYAVKKINRKRLQNYDRDKRERFPARMYQRLFDKQHGACGICLLPLDVPAKSRGNVIDHKDPNEANFNKFPNLQLVHKKCNDEKAAKSMVEQSKHTGRTIADLV
jgi:hypothetical protein